MNPYYKDYSAFLAEHFDGKVQKLSVDVGFTCPNRDGSIGRGGCIYCNNMAFSPDWDKRTESVAAQIARGKAFFGKKYPDMRYLAYFQSYTSTYAPEEKLLTLYREALAQPDVVGLIIGTRPDCMPDSLLDSIADLDCKVFIAVTILRWILSTAVIHGLRLSTPSSVRRAAVFRSGCILFWGCLEKQRR